MSDPELSRLLSELNKSASQLNVESNSINYVIQSIEQQIRTANVGIEVWLEGDQAMLTRTVSDLDERGERYVPAGRSEMQVGFAKLATEWTLAVRNKVLNLDGSEYIEGEITPLLKTSRDTRLAALEKLPTLITELRTAAENALAAIRQARKLIE